MGEVLHRPAVQGKFGCMSELAGLAASGTDLGGSDMTSRREGKRGRR